MQVREVMTEIVHFSSLFKNVFFSFNRAKNRSEYVLVKI